MRIVITVDQRPRPKLRTPAIGSEGDKTIASDVVYTEIDNLLRRYAGNLAELKAWQHGIKYGVQMDDSLQQVHDKIAQAAELFDEWKDSPFGSIAEAAAAWTEGTFDAIVYNHLAKGNNKDEAHENQTAESKKDVHASGQPPASQE